MHDIYFVFPFLIGIDYLVSLIAQSTWLSEYKQQQQQQNKIKNSHLMTFSRVSSF